MSNEIKQVKHTLGPWNVKRVLTPEHDDDPLGAYIVEEAQDKLSTLYFEADYEDEALRTEQLDALYSENNANMQLIAAAPDLLKACKQAYDFAVKLSLGSRDEATILSEKLIKLITKAEGR